MTNPFWSLPKSRVIHQLDTDEVRGLTSVDVRKRLARYGQNRLVGKSGPSSIEIYFRQFKSPLLYILLFAAAFSAFEREWSEVTVIMAVVVLNSLIGFFQERKAEKTMASLRKILSPKAKVLRAGQVQKIDVTQLVPGDIIMVEAGDRVPADARIISCQGLRVNQAALTGESVPAHKSDSVVSAETALIDRVNMLFMSTLVVTGKAKAVVVGSGMKTEIGAIAQEVSSVKELPENMQKQLNVLGRWLLIIAGVSAGVSFLIGAISGISGSEMLKVAITLMVSIIPEGLPIAVTVTLSVGLLRVYRKGAIIRKLAATETLGSTTVICVDKTGTLTEGKMMVERLFVGNEQIDVTGEGYQLSGNFSHDNKQIDPHKRPALQQLLQMASLATMSTISEKDLKNDHVAATTDPTETALAVVAAKAGYYAFAQEKKFPEVLEIPFEQELLYSTSVHDYGRNFRYLVKGAPEKILSLSTSLLGQTGRPAKLLRDTRSALEQFAHTQAAEGYRVTALGYVDYPKNTPVNSNQVKNLTFVGYIMMEDPIRHEVASAIEKARQAGIRVVMITGDHLLTAESIGKRLGLLKDNLIAVHADEISRKDYQTIGVVARATPTQKLKLIEQFQRSGAVVAMTGDGVNDAPALKKSDIGIAMGQAGTDVAVEASDMVLLKDSFYSIVEAVEQGRLIWENTKKVVFLLVSTSLADAGLIIGALMFSLPLPLVPVQILWLNLVTDGLTSMALTVEPEEKNLMRSRPRRISESFINRSVIIRMLLLSAVMVLVTVWIYQVSLPQGVEYARTVALTMMVFFQLANVFNSRSAEQSVFSMPFWSNRLLLVTVFASAIVHYMALKLPFLQNLLGTVELGFGSIMLLLALSLTIILVDELRKFILLTMRRWAIAELTGQEEYNKANGTEKRLTD